MAQNQLPRFRCLAPALAAIISLATLARGEIRITEIMAAGQAVVADEDGGYPDWIEIHNPDGGDADLSGWHLTDDPSKPKKWAFPAGPLAAGGYQVVFASAKDRPATFHTNFRLTSGGEYLALTRPDGSVAQEFIYSVQIPDLSFDGVHFLASPTPGATNAEALTIAMAPVFSAAHGFYEEPITVALMSATDGAVIRYTLDGTEPDATHGNVYTAPLKIAKTTAVRAVAVAEGARPSPIVTATYLFRKDIVKQSPDGMAPPEWPKKWGQHVVDYGMDPRITQRKPYKSTIKDDLLDAPTLSIAMALPDLFDKADGIYANPQERGVDWERPMSIELIDPAGGTGFQVNAGLRIRGGASRDANNPKHSFQVRMRSIYGAPELKYPLFGPDGAPTLSRFDLRWDHLVSWHYSSDPNATQLQDIFGRDTQLATGSPAKRGNVFHLYINGQYWGVYFTDERVTADWAAREFGGGDDDYDVVKFDYDANFGTGYADGTPYAWRRLFDAGTRGFASNADYFRVQGRNADGSRNPDYERQLDVDNLIDYMVTGIYCAATDNPPSGGTQNNWYACKSRKGDFGWRFFAHDYELSLASVNDDVINREPPENPFESASPESVNPWHYWEALRQNAEFRLRVADHLQKLFFNGGVLTPEATAARWQARMDELSRAMVPESARWGQPAQGGVIWQEAAKDKPAGPGGGHGGGSKKQFTHADWERAANAKLTDYFPTRSGIVFQQFKESNLYPSIDAPVFTTGPEGVTISNPNANGQIYYTMDGSDPRKVSGDLSASAQLYSGPIASVEPTLLRARIAAPGSAVEGGRPIIAPTIDWSAIVETTTAPAQDFRGLRVTEILYHPPPLAGAENEANEFLELKNEGSSALDLSGLTFTAGIEFTFPAGTTVAPGAFVVLVRNAVVFAQLHPGVAIGGVYGGRLANEGETITLSTPGGLKVLSVSYDNSRPWPLAADGHGFSLVPSGEGDPNEAEHWRASTAAGGSPGADDPVPPIFARVVINEVLANDDPGQPALSQDFIELTNLDAAPANISGWFLTDDANLPGKFRIPDGTVVPGFGFVVFRTSDFAASGVTLPSVGGEVLLFSGDGTNLTGYAHGMEYGAQTDGVAFGRYVAEDGRESFPVCHPPTPGMPNELPASISNRIRISEIHYAPAASESEFVEIENGYDAVLLLTGVRLNGLGYMFPDGATVPPNSRCLVVTIDPEAFRAAYGVPAEVPIFGPASGTLQDDGELVSMDISTTVDGETGFLVVEEVRYNDKRPWPTAAAGHGYSLQRIPGPNFGGEPASWIAALPTPGTDVGNVPPSIKLVSPLPLSDIVPPAIVHFSATATDVDGEVAKVEFLVDNEVVGEADAPPFEFDWRPTPGLHDLTARATDDGGAVTESGVVTIDVDAPSEGTGLGLRGEYFANTTFDGTPVVRNDPAIASDWFETPPIAGVPRKGFSVRWSGSVLARRSGEHSFNLGVTGRARLIVDGQTIAEVTEEPKDGQIFFMQGSTTLTAGVPADIVLEYIDTDGAAHVELRWTEPGDFTEVTIPQTQLFVPGQDPSALGIASVGQLPPRQVGREFRTQLQAANGPKPYAWSISSGSLPDGVTLSATGLLSGIPNKAGAYTFIVRVEDAASASAEKPFSVTVIDTSHPEWRPIVEILTPADGTSFQQSEVVRVTGNASGKRPLAAIEYTLNGSPWHSLPGSTAWSIALTPAKGLRAGTNDLRVRAVDADGRRSTMQARNFARVVYAQLTVSIEGAGTVTSGFLGRSRRLVGKDYTIEATPAPGWIFSEWQGAFAFGRRLTFAMEDGLELKAVFIRNPYPALAGPYTGLLEKSGDFPGPLFGPIGGGDTETPLHFTRGVLDVRLSAGGSFTASLRFTGRTYKATGRFDVFGSFFKQFRDPRDGATIFLSMNFTRDTGIISANVGYSNGEVFTNAECTLSRCSFSTANPCPVAHAFTTRLAPGGDSLPAGSGFATLNVKANGKARWVGELADGTPWSASALVSDGLSAPLYTPLYNATSSLSGLVSFDKSDGLRGAGDLVWSRLDLAVPAFEDVTAMAAAAYTAPATGTPAIDLQTGRLVLDGGGLENRIEKTVSLGNDNVFVINGDAGESISLRVDPATGVMDGSFVFPGGGTTKLRGIVNQLDATAAGYFSGPQIGGSVEIGPVIVGVGLRSGN